MRIILDIDDVLADTFGALENQLGPAVDASIEILEVMFPRADLAHFLQSVEFHREISPIEGAAEGVKWIIRGALEVIYVTSRFSEMEAATQIWLEESGFPQAPLYCIGGEPKKGLLRSHPYDLLIDDQLRYLSIARDHGKRTIALANPWNTSWDGVRARNWQEIKRAI